jgi:hypothetical protein
MPHAHPNGARTRPTPPADHARARPVLRLDLAADTPGWTLTVEHGDGRPLTVRQAVAHAIDTDGPAAVPGILSATRDALAELPEQTAQLRAELVSATPRLLADVDDGLTILRDVLDALAPTASPDVMGALRGRTRRLAARASTARRQLAAIGRTGGR